MHRHAIDVPQRVAGRQQAGQVLLEALLDGPQVSGLAQEGGAVDPAKAGESIGVVVAAVPEQSGVLVEAEEFADPFDGQNLTIGQLGREAPLSNMVEVECSQRVIDQTEDRKHIIIQGHGASPRKTAHSTAAVEESTLTY
jgi:hypothetical protein